jgi:hypothetical protein
MHHAARDGVALSVRLGGIESGMNTNLQGLLEEFEKGLTEERIAEMAAARAEFEASRKRAWAESLPKVMRHLVHSETWMDLEAAVNRGRIEDVKILLPGFLHELGLDLPAGVLRAPRGKAGRPASEMNQMIYGFWLSLGRPKPAKLAREIFGKAYTTASPADRKRAADQCAASVKRWNRRNRT